MCVAWIRNGIERGHRIPPHQGENDGPTQPYPTACRAGRGSDRALLPHRRCLRPPQPRARSYESMKCLSDSEVIALTLFQQLQGVECHARSCATHRGSSRTCSPGGGASSFLVSSDGEEAQALFGAPQAADPLRDDRRPGAARSTGTCPRRLSDPGRSTGCWTPPWSPRSCGSRRA